MTNLCDKCDSKVICKIYDSIYKFSNVALIKVDRCQHYLSSNKEEVKIPKVTTEKENTVDFDSKLNNSIDKMLENQLSKLNDSEKHIRKTIDDDILKDIKHEDIVVNGETKTLYYCPSCNCKDYSDGLFVCEECGDIACSDCGVYDNSSMKNLCDKCWKNIDKED